jgi:WD40 repeat protein
MRRHFLCSSICCWAILIFAQLLQAQASPERPELVAQTGHVLPIWKLAFSDDGRLLASASFTESSVVLWDVANEQQLRTFTVQAGAGASFINGVRSLALSPNGRTLAIGTDSEITVFNVEDGKELYHFVSKAHGLSASLGNTVITFSPSSRLLAALEGNSIETWDLNTGNTLRSLPQPGLLAGGDLVFSSDENHLAASTYSQGVNGTVRVFDLSSGNVQEHPFSGRLPPFINHGIAYAPDGHLVVLSISRNSHKSAEEEVMITDVTTAAKTTIAKINDPGGGISFGATFSADGSLVAISEGDTVRIVDAASHHEIKTFSVPITNTVPLNYLATAFTKDQKLIATGSADGRIRLWDPLTALPKKALEGHANLATAATFSQDGSRLFTGSKTQWDLSSGIGLRATSPQSSSQIAVISADGRFLAGANLADSAIQVWDLVHHQLVQNIRGPQDTVTNRMAISPDGSTLAVTYRLDYQGPGARQRNQAARQQQMQQNTRENMKNLSAAMSQTEYTAARQALTASQAGESPESQVKLWNIQSGSELLTLKGHTEMIGALSFTADGKRVVSVSKAEVRVWASPSGKLLNNYQTSSAPQSPMGILASGTSSLGFVNAVALSPDGQALAIAEKKMVTEFDTAAMSQAMAQMATARQSRAKRGRFSGMNPIPQFGKKPEPPVRPQFDPTKGGIHVEGPVELFSMSDGQPVGTLPGHANGADSVAFSPDGKLLASGGEDHVIRLWSIPAGSVVREFSGETSAVNSLSFSPDGKLLCSSSNSGSTRIWEIATGEQLATLFSLNNGADWLVVTPDGLFDGSPAAWRQIMWRYGGNTFNVYPVEIFFNEFFFPGLLADIYAGKRPRATAEISRIDRRQPEVQLAIASATQRTASVNIHVTQAAATASNPKGSGAKDLRLFRNGLLVQAWHADLLQGGPDARFTATVPIIAGENRFTAYAFNSDNVKSQDAVSVVQGAVELRRPATTYLLAVGVNQSANPDYNLRFAVADAQLFAEEVKQRQENLPVPSKVEIITLLNEQATRGGILSALSGLAKKVLPEDHVVIFFASHGTAAKNRFYIIPHDLGYAGSRDQLDETAVNNILAHSISDLDLQKAFEPVDAAEIVVVIDACNSGQALEAEEKRRGPMNSKGLAQLAYEKGMYILTAAQSYQAALEVSQLGHGLLTYSLIEEALVKNQADDDPKDGKITVREWLDYSTKRVPEFQSEKLQEARQLRRALSFGDAGKDTGGLSQRPKVFYRRELEESPWVVAASAAQK